MVERAGCKPASITADIMHPLERRKKVLCAIHGKDTSAFIACFGTCSASYTLQRPDHRKSTHVGTQQRINHTLEMDALAKWHTSKTSFGYGCSDCVDALAA